MFSRLRKLGSPVLLFGIAARVTPWFKWPALALTAAGLAGGILSTPSGHQADAGLRIAYLQLASTWLSLAVFSVMAALGAAGLVWRLRMAHATAAAAAPIGAVFVLLALVTGSLRAEAMRGTYWVWNAWFVLELALLLLYAGYIALVNAFPDRRTGDRAGAVLAVLGVLDLPVIYFSVYWWSSRYRGTGVPLSGLSGAGWAFWPLPVLTAGFVFYFGWLVSLRLRIEILRRHHGGCEPRRTFE